MRLDKYLKVSRIIKRRTIAKEASDSGRIIINGKLAKASTEVKEGDIIEIQFGEKSFKAEITKVTQQASKDSAGEMFKVIEE